MNRRRNLQASAGTLSSADDLFSTDDEVVIGLENTVGGGSASEESDTVVEAPELWGQRLR